MTVGAPGLIAFRERDPVMHSTFLGNAELF